MATIYNQWDPYESQVYDSSCGNTTESNSDFSKAVGAEFIMDAPGNKLSLTQNGVGTYWPTGDDTGKNGAVTQFSVLSGTFEFNSMGGVQWGIINPFELTMQRDGVMSVTASWHAMAPTDQDASVNVEMFDSSNLNVLSPYRAELSGSFSVNDNAYLVFSAAFIDPKLILAELNGQAKFDLITDNLEDDSKNPWKIVLNNDAPTLSLVSYSGQDPLQMNIDSKDYPAGIFDFASDSLGTINIDTPINAQTNYGLSILNKRKLFAIDGVIVDTLNSPRFNRVYSTAVRDGQKVGVITLIKIN